MTPPPPPPDAPEAQGSGLADLTTAPQPATGDAYDALTDLFLGPGNGGARQGAPAATAARPAASRPRVEGLILGHLPVMASAWVMQYARSLAGPSGGAVALVRLRGGEVTLELVGGAPPAGECADLQSAVAVAAGVARGWLVQVEESGERVLAATPGLDTLTLLTGADEAAIVSAYQALKDMLAPGGGPEVRLAIMGAAPQKGAESAERIARTAGAFLGRKISVVACVSKIGPGRSATLFRGPLSDDPDRFLEAILNSIHTARAGAPRPQVSFAPTAPPPIPVMEPVRAAPPRRPVPAATTAQGSLAQHLPGLEPLGFVCPYAPMVELAIDEGGGMHLLARADGGLGDALASMMTVSAWAMQHERLIGLAAAGVGRALDAAGPVAQHLFTADARSVRPFLDAPVKLHLLAPVTVEGRQGWFCTELN